MFMLRIGTMNVHDLATCHTNNPVSTDLRPYNIDDENSVYYSILIGMSAIGMPQHEGNEFFAVTSTKPHLIIFMDYMEG